MQFKSLEYNSLEFPIIIILALRDKVQRSLDNTCTVAKLFFLHIITMQDSKKFGKLNELTYL